MAKHRTAAPSAHTEAFPKDPHSASNLREAHELKPLPDGATLSCGLWLPQRRVPPSQCRAAAAMPTLAVQTSLVVARWLGRARLASHAASSEAQGTCGCVAPALVPAPVPILLRVEQQVQAGKGSLGDY